MLLSNKLYYHLFELPENYRKIKKLQRIKRKTILIQNLFITKFFDLLIYIFLLIS